MKMKPFIYTIAFIAFNSLVALGQTYTGPIPNPTNGYGAEGSYMVATQSFANPNFPTMDIEIFYPAGISTPVPTIFYSHAYGGNNPNNISGFLNFVAGKGYAIVFVPYQTVGVSTQDRYDNLLNGFIKSATDYPDIIDTTRVGFVGHSFGGGASFANAYHCFTALNWGESGRFILAMAQWYSFNISQMELQSFPSDVKLLSIVYEDDLTNDLRMANDIFNNINIPAAEKDYLRVTSDTIGNYIYAADHSLPNNSDFNALDYYAYYRLFDAMSDYVFNGSIIGKDVALGNGSNNQISMPVGMSDLIHSETPNFANEQNTYQFPCSSSNNPREEYCDEVVSVNEALEFSTVSIFPNPANSILHIETDKKIVNVDIFDSFGQFIRTSRTNAVKLSGLESGMYFVKITLVEGEVHTKKLIKE